VTLTADQLADYDRDGFLVVRNAVDDELLGDPFAAADQFAREAPDLDQSTSVIDVDEVASRAAGRTLIRRIKSPHLNHLTFAPGVTGAIAGNCGAWIIRHPATDGRVTLRRRAGVAVAVTARQARTTLAVTLAIDQSANTGRTITLEDA
jgi:hypothetical protein